MQPKTTAVLDALSEAVIDRFAQTPDPRLRELMGLLVKHLHAFAHEACLTESEWLEAITFLTSVGQKCSPTRQEFILLSDVLGLSMYTLELNNTRPDGCTEPTVFGPFYVSGAPRYDHGDDIANGAVGRACRVRAKVCGLDGQPIAGATVDVWQADDEGQYDVQKPGLNRFQARGVLTSRADGSIEFRSVVPEPYPIPTDGPVGKLLHATKRPPWRPAHLHFMIRAEGYETLITHVFRRGDKYLEADPVFGVRNSLVADWVPQSDGSVLLDFNFVLNPLASLGAA